MCSADTVKAAVAAGARWLWRGVPNFSRKHDLSTPITRKGRDAGPQGSFFMG